MVSDIIGSFQDLLSDNKNPFENIMGITTKIVKSITKILKMEILKLINF